MSDIFISYSRKDRAFVQKLVNSLQGQGRDLWIDWENIPLTAEWLEEIYSGIENANSFAFIISPDSVRSEVCNLELSHAIENNKRLVPIVHRELIEAHDQAALHPSISSHNWIFFRDEDNYDEAFASLTRSLDTDLEHLQMHTRLIVRSVEWNDSERDGSLLLRGADLRGAAQWLANAEGKQPAPTQLQHEFVEASLKAASARRRGAVLVAVYGFVVLVLALFAFWQAFNAETRRVEAEDARELAEQNASTAEAAEATSNSNAVLAIENASTAEAAKGTAVFNEALAHSLALASNAQQSLYRDNDAALAIRIALAANTSDEVPSSLAQSVLAQAAYSPGLRLVKENMSNFGSGVALQPGGTLALSVSAENELILWDTVTSEELTRWSFASHLVFAMDFDPTGQTVAVAAFPSDNGPATLSLYDVTSYEQITSIELSEMVTTLAYDPNGGMIALGSVDAIVRVFDATSLDEIVMFADGEGPVTTVAFSPDSQSLYATFDSGDTVSWDVEAQEVTHRLNPDLGAAHGLAPAPSGDRILVGYQDGTIIMWNLEVDEELYRLSGHTNRVWRVVISSDGAAAVSSSYDTDIVYWNLETREQIRRFANHASAVLGLDISDDDKQILSASWDRTVRLWDLTNGAESLLLEGHTNTVRGIANYHDSEGIPYVLSAAQDGRIILWNLETGEIVREFDTTGLAWTSIGISPDQQYVVTGSSDPSVVLWDFAEGTVIKQFEGITKNINTVEFSPDGQTIAVAGDNGFVALIDVESGEIIRQYNGNERGVWRVIFSPDGQQLLSASVDRVMLLWDVDNSDPVGQFEGHEGVIYDVAFSPDGQQVVSASEDASLRLWDVATRTEQGRFDGHSSNVRSVVFSKDGNFILSASADKSLRLWDVATQSELQRFDGHTGTVFTVAFGDDGVTAISGSEDSTIRQWEIRPLDQLILWTLDNRYVPELTCGQRELYRIEPYCNADGVAATITPYLTPVPTVTVTPEVTATP